MKNNLFPWCIFDLFSFLIYSRHKNIKYLQYLLPYLFMVNYMLHVHGASAYMVTFRAIWFDCTTVYLNEVE